MEASPWIKPRIPAPVRFPMTTVTSRFFIHFCLFLSLSLLAPLLPLQGVFLGLSVHLAQLNPLPPLWDFVLRVQVHLALNKLVSESILWVF